MTVEYRGCRRLVYAEVTMDDNETGTGHGYVTGTVKPLAEVAEISKSVETSSEAKYYDNKSSFTIDSEGEDKVTFTIAVPSDEVLAEISGRVYDATKKMFIDCERIKKYFAVGYVIGEEGDTSTERYVWRHKGTFAIPDETSATKDNGTGSNNMSLEFTGIFTSHVFTNGKGTGNAGVSKSCSVKANNLPASCTETKWFQAVATPDTSWT